jgi:hypothetical protein
VVAVVVVVGGEAVLAAALPAGAAMQSARESLRQLCRLTMTISLIATVPSIL